MDWNGELEFVTSFAKRLETMPELPLAPAEFLEAYAQDSARLQDILSLISTLPADRRPPAIPWDDILGPLWRRLFSRGDDISRYLLADLWRNVLLEAGEVERYLRTLTALVASARNFYLFDEALDLAREGREASRGTPSPALTNLINTEGSVHYTLKDWDAAETRYREALAMAHSLPEDADWELVTFLRQDIIGQELFNITEIRLEKGIETLGKPRERWALEASVLLDEMGALPLGPRFVRILCVPRAELAMLRGDFSGAQRHVTQLIQDENLEGPYRYPLLATHHRLMARVELHQGNSRQAYDWIRRALKIGVSHNYPMEEHLVLEDAFSVLKDLHADEGLQAERLLVEDLVHLLEDKDWYTGRSHSRNVSSLAGRIGRALGGPAGNGMDWGLLETAGLVHDIGKLRISWSLLNKIAPISPKERQILQSHSSHGESIMRSIGMEEVARVVGQHHEMLDGSGYPRGVPPDAHAAVVGLCDVFQASVEPNRRYKRPKSPLEALGEIRTLSGSRFHPATVDALERVLGAG